MVVDTTYTFLLCFSLLSVSRLLWYYSLLSYSFPVSLPFNAFALCFVHVLDTDICRDKAVVTKVKGNEKDKE